MLFLGRKENESIVIINNNNGEKLTVTVNKLQLGKVKLGFSDSNGYFTIIREELNDGQPFTKTGCKTKEIVLQNEEIVLQNEEGINPTSINPTSINPTSIALG